MTSDPLEAARAALRAKQGAGARYDDPAAPAETLGLARRGTAYFARLLGHLADGDFSAPSARPGWSRAMLIAHVGYHARTLAELVEARRLGGTAQAPRFASQADLARAGTLSPAALRHLFQHSAKHLDVEWRDLNAAAWTDDEIRALPGQRACEIWHAGVLLGTTGRDADLPVSCRQCLPLSRASA